MDMCEWCGDDIAVAKITTVKSEKAVMAARAGVCVMCLEQAAKRVDTDYWYLILVEDLQTGEVEWRGSWEARRQ